jgi:ketosteroid isomerase-like protein
MSHLAVLVLLASSFAGAAGFSPLQAQGSNQPAADEAAIRQLITESDEGKPLPFTRDRVFWPGPYKKPIVGKEQPEEIPSPIAPSLRKPNSFKSRTAVIRIEVAKSGDLASEFSNAEASFEMPDGKPVSFSASTLRVWRKEEGTWKVAAWFTRPHFTEPAAIAPAKH